MENRAPIFREIHKNTWLRRLSHEGKKLSVGHSKKNENRYWVVFCVHDDCEALLEGYIEPRIAPIHSPEWTISLQNTMHISHALVGVEHDFEFVITSPNEVFRFAAASWDCMKEWVETLRSKLREMKIISPRENVYSKLPETRLPLLPTRDPTSPLPPPPSAIPALVPGVEVVTSTSLISTTPAATSSQVLTNIPSTSTGITQSNPVMSRANIIDSQTDNTSDSSESGEIHHPFVLNPPPLSNTTSRSIMNLLSNPIQAYSAQNSQKVAQNSVASQHGSIQSLSSSSSSTTTSPALQSHRIDFNKSFENSFIETPENAQSDLSDSETIVESEEPSTSSSKFAANLLKIPRPHTTKSTVVEKKSTAKANSSDAVSLLDESTGSTNITIIQLTNPDPAIETELAAPSVADTTSPKKEESDTFNVHIIPSNSHNSSVASSTNDTETASNSNSIIKLIGTDAQTTKVQLNNGSATTTVNNYTGYGKVNVLPDKDVKKIVILPTPAAVPNFTGVTNISVGYSNNIINTGVQDYEAVFFTNSVPPPSPLQLSASTSRVIRPTENSETHSLVEINQSSGGILRHHSLGHSDTKTSTTVPTTAIGANVVEKPITITPNHSAANKMALVHHHQNKSVPPPQSPTAIASTSSAGLMNVGAAAAPNRNNKIRMESKSGSGRQFLTRGLTELNLNRSSRLDRTGDHKKPLTAEDKLKASNEMKAAIEKLRKESYEQRRRSSSASETRNGRENRHMSPSSPHVGRPMEPPHPISRLTLREQQVLHLRKEIQHPGGVRYQLRRKECVGSIALVDAFGAVWIAGWKQKEHPILYNALHIGDQLISIGAIAVSSAAEANKIIRSSQSLYIEITIRRIPFGRVYAIRREIDGQCLGFIRDGNTATIVDIVPNSLAARHGLQPKAKSCDGLSLTFWVLTEINGRPLNLFFKDNEVSDRLNAIGRDISILVQPSDLVTKLKKQLKSLRNHKDFIVQ